MNPQTHDYKLFMKLVDRKPSLVLVVRSLNNFEYVIRQANEFSELKNEYQQLQANPAMVQNGIQQHVIPLAQQNVFAG